MKFLKITHKIKKRDEVITEPWCTPFSVVHNGKLGSTNYVCSQSHYKGIVNPPPHIERNSLLIPCYGL